MLRSHWMKPMVLVLAAAGFAYAQFGPAEQAADGLKDRFISMQEVGRPALKCKLLKSWREPDGAKAYLAQAVDTGETITIVETGPAEPGVHAGPGKAVATRIIHWGSASKPPAGTPEAPADATVLGMPLSAGRPSVTMRPMTTEMAKPPAAKSAPRDWAAMPAKDLPPARPMPAAVVAAPSAEKKMVEPAPMKPVALAPVVAKKEAKPAPAPFVWKEEKPLMPRVEDPVKTEVKKPLEGDNWRQSWGRVTEAKSALVASAEPPPSAPAPMPSAQAVPTVQAVPSAPVEATRHMPAPAKPVKMVTAPPTPKPAKVDPLQQPDLYTRVPTDEMIARKAGEKVKKPVEAIVQAPALPPLPEATKPAPSVQAAMSKEETKAAPETPLLLGSPALSALPPLPGPEAPKTAVVPLPMPAAPATVLTTAPAAAPQPPAIPLGMGSILAAQVPDTMQTTTRPVPSRTVAPAVSTAAMAAAEDDGGNAFSSPRAAMPSRANASKSSSPMARVVPMMPQQPAAFPPNAFAEPVAPTVIATGYPMTRPTASVAAPAAEPSLQDLLGMLHSSLYPSQREWAADRMTAYDWRSNPAMIEGLATAARNDPAPLVRAGCLKALARMKAACEPAIAAAEALKTDADARVSQEAENALNVLQAVRQVQMRR